MHSNEESKIVELFGVYDADATLVGEASYWIGARLGIRHCSLCDITHSLFREKSQWRECVARLHSEYGITFRTFHRNDQPDEVRKVANNTYPVVVARNSSGVMSLFLNNDQITECGIDPKLFFQKIIEKI